MKKNILFALLIGIMILSACQPAAPETIFEEVEVTRVVEGETITEIQEVVVTQVVEVEVEAEPEEPMVEDVGPIRLMHFFGDCEEFDDVTDLAEADSECGIFSVLLNQWNEQNPDTPVVTELSSWPGTLELNTNLAAGTPPDVAVLHGIRIPMYASRGLLTPLDAAFEAHGIDISEYAPAALEYVSYNGQVFGVPFDIHGGLWHLNLDVWAEAGLLDGDGNPILPTTEEEFLVAAETVMDTTGLSFVDVQTDGHNGTVWPFTSFLYQLGGEIADADGNPTVDTAEALQALNLLLTMQAEGYTTPLIDYGTAQERFLNGESASWWTGTWAVNFYAAQADDPESALTNYMVLPFPQIFGSGAWSNAHTLVVPLGLNPDPARADMIVQFLAFMDANQFNWTKVGMMAVKKSVLESDEYLSQPHREEYAEFADVATAYPRVEWIGAYDDILNEEIVAAYIGEKTAEQALADAQQRLVDFTRFK
jgi:multiple sugar transport system substrate-binding protein